MKKPITAFIVFLVLAGGLPVHVWGQPPYFSQEKALYQQALQYIEQHRKSNVTVTILNETRRPIGNASVSYRQTSHDFMFGIFGSPDWATPDDSRGWELYSGLCSVNPVVLLDWEMWATIEPANGTLRWDTADWWFQRITNHCPNVRFVLMFDDLACCGHKVSSWTGISDLSDPSAFGKFREYLHDYVYQVVKRYSDRVDWWITENELNAPPASATLGTPDRALTIDQTVVQAIRDAKSDAKIILELGQLHGKQGFADPFEFAQQALASGLQVDAVSLHAYPNSESRTPVGILWIEYQFRSLHKPVFIQETGYPSQPCQACGYDDTWTAWNSIFNEPTQAAWVKYMTGMTFGTENVLGVVNFADDTWPGDLYKDFGLFTRSGQTKQAYYTLLDQIRMFTTSGNTSTNTQGVIRFRGFAGNYTISVPGYESASIHVSEQGNNTFTVGISSLALRNEASQTLDRAYANLTAAQAASFESPEAKSLLNQSLSEYSIAQQDFNLRAYEVTIVHAQEALNLVHQAYSKESEYQQAAASTQRYATTTVSGVGVEEAFMAVAILAGLSLFVTMLWRRRR